jgi:hypothetical protein
MKNLIKIPQDADLPLVGTIMFGIIDRGTNLLQVRPTSVCNLNCIFCSTDAGPFSRMRISDYEVDLDYLVDWFKFIAKHKGNKKLIAFIDSVGDPLTYSRIVDLVHELNDIRGVERIGIETNGVLLNRKLVDELEDVGLTQINLSLHSLDGRLAKHLSGTDFYNVKGVAKIAEYIAKSGIELILTPVWIPGVNDDEIKEIILFSKKINRNKKLPPLGIQKYQVHKYGRKIKGVKEMRWYHFYKQLEKWEEEFNYKLKIGPRDFGIFRLRPLPKIFKKGEKVKVRVECEGWIKNEMIGVAKNRCITIFELKANKGDLVNVQIVENKHNLYLAKCLRRKVVKDWITEYEKIF